MQAIIGAFKVQSLDLFEVGEKRLGIVYIFYVCIQNYVLINVFIWGTNYTECPVMTASLS